MSQNEIEKIVAFVRDQRRHANTRREWKRRLAAFGFAVGRPAGKPVILALPEGAVICALPRDLRF